MPGLRGAGLGGGGGDCGLRIADCGLGSPSFCEAFEPFVAAPAPTADCGLRIADCGLGSPAFCGVIVLFASALLTSDGLTVPAGVRISPSGGLETAPGACLGG